jgi:tetratricopeptide (TPR) repeat protein
MRSYRSETATEVILRDDKIIASGEKADPRASSLVALALVALALVVALAPQRPGVTALLNAAAEQRAVYRYDRALALYAEVRAEVPGDPRPACAAGDSLALQHEPVAAVAAFQTCVALAPGDANAWLALGDALAATGRASDDEASATAWRKAAQLGGAEGWARLAERAERLGQLDAATSAWAQVPPDGALGDLAAAHLGLLALARGNAEAASAHLARVAHSTSNLAIKMRNAGVFLFAQRTPVLALDWEGIGHALLSLGLPALALGPFQRAVALAPGNGSAHAYYGYTLWILGQRAAARPQITAGLVDPPILPFAYYAAGQVALSDGKAAQALTDFQTGLRSDPHNAALWSAAGDAALASGQYLVAELSYQNAAQESDTPDAIIALIRFYLAQGLNIGDGTALQAARDGFTRFPQSEQLVYLQGLVYIAMDQSDYAQGLFQLARRLDPTDPGPWLYIGRYAAASGDIVSAVEDLRTAIALQPNGPYATQARAALVRLPANTL